MSDDDGTVEVRVPADVSYIKVVRLAASGVAAMAGLDVERIDDLKIAVDEMCATLIEVGRGDPLVVCFRPPTRVTDRFEITVESGFDPQAVRDEARFSLSQLIVGVIADEHELAVGDDGISRYSISVAVASNGPAAGETSAGR